MSKQKKLLTIDTITVSVADSDQENSLQVSQLETSINDPSTNKELAKPKGIFSSWVACMLIAVAFFAVGNLFISDLGKLGLSGLYFYPLGGLIICVGYFIIYYIKFDYSNPNLFDSETGKRRFVWTDAQGKADWTSIGHYVIAAAVQALIYLVINLTFIYSNKANLNIGIPTSIWGITPFFSACLEWKMKGQKLQFSQILGMFFMLLCAVVTSLSGVFISDDHKQTDQSDLKVEKPLPIYVPVLFAFILPIICAFFAQFIRHSFVKLKITQKNWTFAYTLIFSIGLIIPSIIKVALDPDFFEISYFCKGTISSMLSVAGCLFSQAANATGAPIGPIQALGNVQTIVLTVMVAIISQRVPNWLQWLGLFLGLLSAFILTIPDQMGRIWYKISRCKSKNKEDDFIQA